MSSGVSVSDDVQKLYQRMLVQKSGDDPKERPRLATLIIEGAFIQIEKEYRQKDFDLAEEKPEKTEEESEEKTEEESEEESKKELPEDGDVYKFLLVLLKSRSCRYVLYDCHFETNETKKEEIIFAIWNPDKATIKDKMMYSSSKSSLVKGFPGLKHNLAFNGYSEIEDRESFIEKVGTKKVKSLEGRTLVSQSQKSSS